MRILNLYAGIGGNRKLWGDENEITAVEYNPDIAAVYKDFYPKDTVIVGDAHAYLLEHYKEFDFIWGSPPCPRNSRMRICNYRSGGCDAVYPDMRLWQEIIFLENYAKYQCKFVIENVKPYYQPLIKPSVEIERHLFWSNFNIPKTEIKNDVSLEKVSDGSTVFGVNIKQYKMPSVKHKKQILRNMVNPELGKYILDRAMEKEIPVQGSLFSA